LVNCPKNIFLLNRQKFPNNIIPAQFIFMIVLHLNKESVKMKLLSKLATTKSAAVLLAALFAIGTVQTAAAQSHGGGGTGGSTGGGHGAGMAREDPIPFTRDIEKAADDILNQMKTGKTMDARNSVNRLAAATGKLTPHITDAALKERLTGMVNDIKTIAAARSPDLFNLEDKVEVLRTITAEVREKLQGMN
jgi:hypothetical protein